MIRRLRSSALGPTLIVCVLLYAVMGMAYDGFLAPRVAVGFLAENAFLGIAAVGVTLVLISGGIDLSVGAVIGCTSVLIATLVEERGWNPAPAVIVALGLGTALGAGMGCLIHAFELPSFIVTLAGMFFARGLGFVIHREAIDIDHDLLPALYELPGRLAGALGLGEPAASAVQQHAPTTGLVLVVLTAAAALFMRSTPMGRHIHALGSAAESARLMGLPVGRTRIAVYAISGFCSSLGGAVYVLYTFSGNPTAGTMLELDAIAVAVIGGTSLFGGRGSVAGTLLGVVIFGIIQTAIVFDGRLSSWWSRIALGALLLAFVVVQRVLSPRDARGTQ